MTRLTDEQVEQIRAYSRYCDPTSSARLYLDSLLAERAALAAEVERLERTLERRSSDVDHREARIVDLMAEVGRAEAANDAMAGACRDAVERLRRGMEVEMEISGDGDLLCGFYGSLADLLDSALAAHAAGAAGEAGVTVTEDDGERG